MPNINWKREYSIAIFSFFWKKSLNFREGGGWIIAKHSPHLDSDFSLVALFKLGFLLVRQVPKTCSHSMLNPSWDASQWCNFRNLGEKNKIKLLIQIPESYMKFGKCRYRLMPRIYIHVHMDADTVNPKIERLQVKLLASSTWPGSQCCFQWRNCARKWNYK
jgi:hypothetical protein